MLRQCCVCALLCERACITRAERDAAGHQRVASVQQDHLVLLQLESWLESGERIHHLVPAVEHIAMLETLTTPWKRTRWRMRERDRSSEVYLCGAFVCVYQCVWCWLRELGSSESKV